MAELSRKQLTTLSKILRCNMTKEECHLWYDFLKALPVPVYRQKVIGPYIVDFYCARAKLVIELDGSQHNRAQAQEKDFVRDEYLQSLGILVLRYSNLAVRKSFPLVCEDICRHIDERRTLQ